ncbi:MULTISPECIES: hypothetical protein [unclassified Cryobacterium]|uniref:hypothetical protein n=1 Tax=unclassified Cryobacterium TaxID=2649013 RepID=UPI002AB4BF91|nr:MULTISPECIES: hypothetical protein [unclassified Cryobacterium]MDY7542589.1 hypothetical protein [Cryobacterium sp. 5B3]MEB0264709.1 hypothetical protein [Cryobacterium sp. 10I5]MEB0273681.1 hypothetical protein [Cryobacterium sp. 5B3]
MKLQKLAIILAALTIAAGFLGLSVVATSQAGTIHDQGSTIQTLAENSDALRQQVKDTGEVPVAPPADAIVDAAPTTPGAGARGLTGDTGAVGRPPTSEEVAGSVASYCVIRLDCTGPTGPASLIPGAKGDTGTAGQDSQIPGQTGATGDTGATGAVGAIGLTGTSVTAIACQGDGYWLFTLTLPDSTTTTQTVAGPCRVDPMPAPIPTQGVTP